MKFVDVFKTKLGDKKYNLKYDIAPATYGEGEWKEIYCLSNPDDNIDLRDFIVFAGNYGKTYSKVVENVKILTSLLEIEVGQSAKINAEVNYSDGTKDTNVSWELDNSSVAKITSNGLLTMLKKGIVKVTASRGGVSDSIIIESNDSSDNEIVIYIEENQTISLYAWTGSAPQETKLLGAWPGKDLTEKEGKFYYKNFGSEYDSINYIHFIGGQSPDLSTSSSIWITKDGEIHKANPYEPSKPIIEIKPLTDAMNGEQQITISFTAINNTVDGKNVKFNGNSIEVLGEETTILIGDYLNNGESGILEITAENDKGVVTKNHTITRDDNVKGLKLYLEKNRNVYAWVVDNGNTIDLNGGWPGKPLSETELTKGKTWYVLDFSPYESGNYILDSAGGADQSISSPTWIDINNKKYNIDPYEPTKPILSVNPGSGIYKGKKEVSIKIEARNAGIDNVNVTGNGKNISLNNNELVLKLSELIENNEELVLVVEASNEIGSSRKEITIKRDDEYQIPTGEFTWDNASIYFVITDRFFNGNPDNDHSYGRKNNITPDPLNVATYHGGDIAGLTKKIDDGYFDELGVSAIWVSAMYEQIHGWVGGGSGDFPHFAYHGYYALDWTMSDRNMGTIDEIREFVDTAHEHNIRVVMDVVVNHAGYNTVMDMYDYNFASFDKGVIDNRDWMHPLNASGWQSHHGDKPEGLVFYKAEQMSKGKDPSPISDWLNWWGPDWVRSGIDGYDAGNGVLEEPLAGLPDIRTELTNAVEMAPIMKTKWGKESSSDYNSWIVPAAKQYRDPNLRIAPADFIIKNLAAWVEEFGIDGFRCDTAKHIELSRWKQLKNESSEALKKWRSKNPDKYGANWDEDFWMVGEHWDFKKGGDDGYYSNGFDAMIDFGFPLKNGSGDLGGTWQGYSDTGRGKYLPYLNSHDMGKVGFFGKGGNCIPAGTALLLTPGPVQIFYGDENDRPKGPNCSDPDHPVRSDYVWGANPEKLAHWQKLGRFRNMNPSVGAGKQTMIETDIYMREYKDNKVLIVINTNGSKEINVKDVFTDGTKLRNAYNGETGVVEEGSITFNGENGLILIETIKN